MRVLGGRCAALRRLLFIQGLDDDEISDVQISKTRNGEDRQAPANAAQGDWLGAAQQLEDRTMLTSAAFALTGDWGSGFGGQITITNTQPTAVNNWTLSFNWDR